MAPHVQWEFDMLFPAAEKCAPPNPTISFTSDITSTISSSVQAFGAVRILRHKTVESLFLESLLVHLRNVLHFLFAVRSNPKDDIKVFATDVLASDYALEWQLARPLWLPEYWVRLNKLLAHLSMERMTYIENRKMEWPQLQEKVKDVSTAYIMFLRSLPLERQEWFRE